MSEITAKAIIEWMGEAPSDDLTAIADILIERGFAYGEKDIAELEHELARREEEDEIEPDLIGDARDRLRRREYGEVLHVLSLALGPDFDALDKLRLVPA